jgi:hypothetical protein
MNILPLIFRHQPCATDSGYNESRVQCLLKEIGIGELQLFFAGVISPEWIGFLGPSGIVHYRLSLPLSARLLPFSIDSAETPRIWDHDALAFCLNRLNRTENAEERLICSVDRTRRSRSSDFLNAPKVGRIKADPSSPYNGHNDL